MGGWNGGLGEIENIFRDPIQEGAHLSRVQANSMKEWHLLFLPLYMPRLLTFCPDTVAIRLLYSPGIGGGCPNLDNVQKNSKWNPVTIKALVIISLREASARE